MKSKIVFIALFATLIGTQAANAAGFYCTDTTGLSVTTSKQDSLGGMPGAIKLMYNLSDIAGGSYDFTVEHRENGTTPRLKGYWDKDSSLLISVGSDVIQNLEVRVRDLKKNPDDVESTVGKMDLTAKIGDRTISRSGVSVICYTN